MITLLVLLWVLAAGGGVGVYSLKRLRMKQEHEIRLLVSKNQAELELEGQRIEKICGIATLTLKPEVRENLKLVAEISEGLKGIKDDTKDGDK